jgi:RNA polymerase sigma-70 factor (ECF subfamily)
MAAGAQEFQESEAVRPRAETRPDEILVASAIEGEELAFEDLVSRHRPAALRVATGIVGPTLAEDVVQESLLLAHRALASLQDRAKFSRWLLAITRWRALRVGRLESRHAVGHVRLDDPDLETFSHLASDPRQTDPGDGVLLAALEDIPPEYAEVIRYHFLHDLPHQKIADFLGVPLSTVKWRCFRGKEILRCTLSPEPTCPTVCRKGCAKYPVP